VQSPSRLVWLVWAGLSIVFAYSLTLPVATLPGNRPWLRRFDTPEIAEGRVFSQTFTMDRDGLTAIEFNFDPVGPPSRDFTVTLLDVTIPRSSRIVSTQTIRVHALGDRRSFRFEFPPIPDSRFHSYEFDVSGGDGRSGYALVAARGDGYTGGTLGVDGRARWSDLIFQTDVSPPVASTWTTLWTRRGGSGRASGKLILALLGLNWIAVGFLLRAVAQNQPSPRE